MAKLKTQTGSKTAPGYVTLDKDIGDTLTLCQISGTYGTVTLTFEGSVDDSLFFSLAAQRMDTGAIVTGTIAPTDNSTFCWKIPSEGLSQVRVHVTNISTGQADFNLQASAYLGVPFMSVQQTGQTVSGLTTFGAGITFNGSSTANVVSMPDNLADALNVKEGSNSYLKFVTTDSGEKLVFGKVFDVPAGWNATGATGVNLVSIPDNLASALDITEGSNSYLKFTTTDNSETVVLGKNLTIADAKNIVINTSTGTKIGTGTTQKIGFHNATPVAQHSSTADVTGFAAGSGTTAKSDSVWAGASGATAYTVGDIVTCLKAKGFMAE